MCEDSQGRACFFILGRCRKSSTKERQLLHFCLMPWRRFKRYASNAFLFYMLIRLGIEYTSEFFLTWHISTPQPQIIPVFYLLRIFMMFCEDDVRGASFMSYFRNWKWQSLNELFQVQNTLLFLSTQKHNFFFNKIFFYFDWTHCF